MEKSNRIGIFLGHPSHFHMFKHVTTLLEEHGYEVDYLVKSKDILEDLVRESGHNYYTVRKKERTAKGIIGLAWAIFRLEMKVISYIIRRRPRLLIGTYSPVISRLTGVPVIVCCEDDVAMVPRFAKISYPYASAILSPIYCDGGQWDSKMTKYYGFQKLAYLHPNRFIPNSEILTKYGLPKHYILIRLVKLTAHHDDEIRGLTLDLVRGVITKAENYGYRVYISSESILDRTLQPYRLNIDYMDIHHVLSFAGLLVSDSQSMSVEAAMLGVPSIRFRNLIGRTGVINELEYKYFLTFGVAAEKPNQLLELVNSLLSTPNLQDLFQQRRTLMLNDHIDVTAFLTWFIENFPESKTIMKENYAYQYIFR